MLSILLAASLISGCSDSPTTATTPHHKVELSFTATQATQALAEVTTLVTEHTPRDATTPGAEQAAHWLQSRLQERGVTVEIDTFTDKTPKGDLPFHNVIATIPGASPELIVLISHFDTMSNIGPDFEGANDSGSSTGLLLELAAMLQNSAPLPCTVVCAFMDGEECMFLYGNHDGFHGSKHYARKLKSQDAKLRAAICIDMIGDRDLNISIPRNSTPALRTLALTAADATGLRQHIKLYPGNIYDDHQAFLDCGFPAINLIDFEFGSRPGLNDYWHTEQDTLDKLSADSLLITGRIVTGMLNQLLNAPTTQK